MASLSLLVLALLLAVLIAACGGGGGGGTPDVGETPQAGETPSDGETPADAETPSDGGGGGGGGGEAFEDIPLPGGADETSTVTISGSQFPFFVPTESGVDAEAFGDITMKEYDVGSSPADVIDFYKSNRGDWEEAFAVSTDEGGLLIWTKDGGNKAVWISVSEGSDAGTSTLAVIQGLTQ